MDKLMKKKIILIVFFFFILSISLFVRFYDLEADSFTHDKYGTIWFDEASWFHNARNKVLFGSWDLENDLWKPRYFSPILNLFGFFSFSIFGVSIFSMRLVSSLLGLISILIASFLLLFKNPKEGIIYFILLSMNTMLISYSRVGMSESIALFFIIIILGLIYSNNKYSWWFAGFFVPFLFFSKMTSLFFILAIPISFILYMFMYKSKNTLKKFKVFLFGAIISGISWLFWLIPNIKDWIFINLIGNSSRIEIGIHKTLGAILKIFKFSLINQVSIIIAIISILFTIQLLCKKQKISFIDLFLIVSLILFSFQIFFADYSLRRFVLIVPIILLMSTRFIFKFGDINFHIKENSFKISKGIIVILFIVFYFLFHFSQLAVYFGRVDDFDTHIVIKNSKDVGKYIPEGEKVYGSYAMALALENKIQPYFMDKYKLENEPFILELMETNKMYYAIIRVDLSDEKAVSQYYIYSIAPSIYDYIEKNFEIIAVLDSKSPSTNCLDRKAYIYRRKDLVMN